MHLMKCNFMLSAVFGEKNASFIRNLNNMLRCYDSLDNTFWCFFFYIKHYIRMKHFFISSESEY